MTKLFKQVVSLATVATFAVSLASCKKDVSSDEIDPKYEWLDTSISDTSDLSSYSGSTQLDLVGWSATQTGGDLKKESSEDVVSAEIKRVTGVSVSKRSFDNGGMVAAEKFKQLLTTKSIPDFVYGSGGLSAVDPSYLWDLTDLIKTYCPTILERIPDYVWDYCKIDGKIYGIPYMLARIPCKSQRRHSRRIIEFYSRKVGRLLPYQSGNGACHRRRLRDLRNTTKQQRYIPRLRLQSSRRGRKTSSVTRRKGGGRNQFQGVQGRNEWWRI